METEAESAYVSCLEMIGEVDAESGPTPRPVKNTGQFSAKQALKRGPGKLQGRGDMFGWSQKRKLRGA